MEIKNFNPAEAAKNIKDDFVDYILSSRFCYSEDLRLKLRKKLKETIAKGPYVSISDIFKTGSSLNDLAHEKDEKYRLSLEFLKLEERKIKKNLPLDRPLYLHQEKAYRKVCDGRNIVVTTGTGSGKTESFLIPIFNEILKEKDNGTLDDNVRAIIIYPMNALANDQIKRLRQYLLEYPYITFGIYTGETKEEKVDALGIYEDLHNNDIEELREPLPNERISRSEMKERPPHILITNYSMLDYMMLRPDDNRIFNGKNIRFVVLDEVHTYRGARGIETALLLSRLKARVIEDRKIQYILTSATLGEQGKSEDDILSFVKNLTGENFESGDIIFSERTSPNFSQYSTKNAPITLFEDLFINKFSSVKEDFEKYNIFYDDSRNDCANVYRICMESTFYRFLRQNYIHPVTIFKIASWLGINEEQAVAFLSSCSFAESGGKKLLDLRYHFFLRALEGGYISLSGEKQVSLVRKEYVRDSDQSVHRMFEFAICQRCGDIALVGAVENDKETGKQILNSNNPLSFFYAQKELHYFHIVRNDSDKSGEVEENIENDDVEFEGTEQDDYWLCPECGEIAKGAKPTCEHNSDNFVHLRSLNIKSFKSSIADKCLFCFSGNYQRFSLGEEAPTAIMATSLFEELPTKEKKKRRGGEDYILFEGGKQFLMFSDSRSEAAFFACYLSDTTKRLIARRGLVKLLEKKKEDIIEDSEYGAFTAEDAIEKLSRLFRKEKTFVSALSETTEDKHLREESFQMAARTVMIQLVTARNPTSLQSMGFLKYYYRGVTSKLAQIYQKQYFTKLSENQVFDLLNELALFFGYMGVFKLSEEHDSELSLESRLEIFNTQIQKRFILQKKGGESNTVFGWIPKNLPGKPNEYYYSLRQDMVMKAMSSNDPKLANEFLKDYWDYLDNHKKGIQNDFPLVKNGSERYMPLENFGIFVSGCNKAYWYRCSNCGRVVTNYYSNECSIFKCHGSLRKIDDFSKLYAGNHYYSFYKADKPLKACIVKEHTAQLTRKTSQEYQREFEQNEINALSCSTTFELGVNVGDLETVFMRNVPPTPANYAQRAGRAGRSKEACAFVMTYAKLSSHDFHYFDEPLNMVEGKMLPPAFSLENPKILYRHINSVVLSYFFRLYPDFYSSNHGKNFIQNGYSILKKIINSARKGDELSNLLMNSFPKYLDNEFSISDFAKSWKYEKGKDWISCLIGEDGNLEVAISEYNQELERYDKTISFLKKQEEDARKNGISSDSRSKTFENRKSRYEDPELINFLIAANVLPKFGFPVDVVSLRQKKEDGIFSGDELNLSREMSQAIGDYAPGVKVIADGKMYTPRYIRKVSRGGNYDFDGGFVKECPNCKTINYFPEEPVDGIKCIGCKEELQGEWTKAIQPTNGLYTDGTIKPVPLEKPKKLYRSQANYVGRDVPDHKFGFKVGDKNIIVYSSERDKIVVTSELDSPFYVCEKCGYSLGKRDEALNKDFKQDKKETGKLLVGSVKFITGYHKRPDGSQCSSHSLQKRHLVHEFNTDIVQIFFSGKYVSDEETIISVLTALLDATSRVLDIERNDISGCVRFNSSEENTNIRFIFFDNVAGGAGHVKRILNGDGAILKDIIFDAYSYMKKCDCDPSCYKCLRSYENQKFHDKLNRFKAMDFLSDYIGKSFNPSEIKNQIELKLINPFEDDFSSLEEAFKNYLSSEEIQELNSKEIPLPDGFYFEIQCHPNSYVLFAWIDKKVLLYNKEDLNYSGLEFLESLNDWKKIDIKSDQCCKQLIECFE